MSVLSVELYKRLPERVKTHYLRDMTFEQGFYLARWLLLMVVCTAFGFAWLGLPLFLIGIYRAKPTPWGTRYFLAKEKRSDTHIRRNNYVVSDPTKPPEHKANRQIPLRVYDFGQYPGTVYNSVRGTDTVLFRVRGRAGAFGSLHDRARFESDVDEVVKSVIAETGGNIEYAHLNGSRPVDIAPRKHKLMYGDKPFLHSTVREPQVDVDRWLLEQVAESIETEITQDVEPTYYLSVTVPRPFSWAKYNMAVNGARPELIPGSLLDRIAKSMMAGLQSVGYQGVSVLSGPEIHRYVFRTWNMTYAFEQLTHSELAYDPSGLEWPTEGMWAYENYIQTNDSYHAVLIVTRFQSNAVLPGGLRALLDAPINWLCTAMCSSVVSPTVENFVLEKSARIQIARAHSKFGPTGALTQKDRDIVSAPVEEHDELYFSRSRPVRFSIPIVISATSKEQLDRNIESVMTILRQLKMVAVRVEGPTRLLRIFVAATLGLRT
ncbi:MAG: hypothetical protein WAW60_01835 [Candidatus Saccharimonadales bacterium]